MVEREPRPRVLFVANDSNYFRAHWIERAGAAKAVGYDVHLAMPPGASVSQLESQGFPIHLISMSRQGRNPLVEVKTIFGLVRLYRKLEPDLVHHLTIKPVLYGGIATNFTRVKAVISAITGLGYVFGGAGYARALLRRFVILLYRLALRHRNLRVTFENREDREEFIRLGLVSDGNSVVIKGAGVDMTKFTPSAEPDGKPIVALPARLLWDKGIGDFVEAATLLRAEGTDARFVLVGDTDPGNPSAVARKQLETWHRKGIVEWLGFRIDMPAVFRSMHIVCLPTFYPEGVPRVLIEAAACGRPIVATDRPGCREVVQDGDNGLLVPAHDAAALARALRRLIEDPVLRKRMGARGRARAESEFSQELVHAQTLAVYRELLG